MKSILALLALATLSGCVSPFADVELPEGSVVVRQAFLASDMTLVDVAPAEVTSVRAGSFFGAWVAGTDYPTWKSAPTPTDVAIENLTVDLTIRVTGPVARTFRFPDLMVYGGSGDAWMSINTTQTPPVLVPGETYTYSLVIPPPAGGLWLPTAESLGIKVVPVMHQNDAADVEIVLGGARPSRAAWTERIVESVPSGLPLASGTDAGDLAGSEYAGQAAPASARHRTVVPLNDSTLVLLAWMNTTENQGVPDLDLELVSPAGDSLVFAGTPTPREHIRLAAFNLAGAGDYTFVTHNYGSARAKFTLEWAVLG